MSLRKWLGLMVVGCLVLSGCSTSTDVEHAKPATTVADDQSTLAMTTTGELADPVRLEADGEPIDIGSLSKYAHAGPTIADVDCDGDQDLLVGDFPGYFWFFENESDDEKPQYISKGKFEAGGEAAKTPVY